MPQGRLNRAKYCLAALALSACVTASPRPIAAGTVEGDYWIVNDFAPANPNSAAVFANPQSVRVLPNGHRVMSSTLVYAHDRAIQGTMEKYVVSRSEYDCAARQMRVLEVVDHDKHDAVLARVNTSMDFRSITPETVGAKTADHACAAPADWGDTLHDAVLPPGTNLVEYADLVAFHDPSARETCEQTARRQIVAGSDQSDVQNELNACIAHRQ